MRYRLSFTVYDKPVNVIGRVGEVVGHPLLQPLIFHIGSVGEEPMVSVQVPPYTEGTTTLELDGKFLEVVSREVLIPGVKIRLGNTIVYQGVVCAAYFRAGQYVRLWMTPGAPAMTVKAVRDDVVEVFWFDSNQVLREATFYPDWLDLV